MLKALSIVWLPFIVYSNAQPTHAQTVLATQALAQSLQRGAPILGYDTGCSRSAPTCDWMAKLADKTNISSLNIPGTHDAATWNYTDATQQMYINYTGPIPDASNFRCQTRSLFQQLNDGIRAFDLRIAYNPDLTTIGFYHSQALLAPNTTIEDVFYGFYTWLDKHPTEALLISINHESGTGTPNDANFYQHLYNLLQQPLAKKYWVQKQGYLGTLGETRGKIILLQRFEYTLIGTPSDPSPNPFGLLLPPEQWLDNEPIIDITYNISGGTSTGKAFIEDFYEPEFDVATTDIEAKFNATSVHLKNATTSVHDKNQLWISFSSAEQTAADVTPEEMAIGNSTLGFEGVNQKLIPFLNSLGRNKRVGIVMTDFYYNTTGLVEAIIGV